MTQALVERYADRLHGVLCCYDRMVVTGTLPGSYRQIWCTRV
jgi:hypothetical protein